MTDAAAAPAGSANARRWPALALLCAVQFMVVLDVSVVNLALPSVAADLGFSEAGLQWIVSVYALTFGGFLLLAGRAADLFGRRRFFMVGLALFTLSSLACGLAPSPTALVVARAAQGLGAAVVSPAALSLLTTTFREGEERNRALGFFGAVAAGGGSAGLLLGGAIVGSLGWEWVFFVNVPIGAAAIALAPVLLRESRDRSGAARLDLLGALTVTAGLVLLVFGLSRVEGVGFGSPQVLLALALAVALVAAFRIIEGRVAAPLVPFRVFRSRTLTGANLVVLASSAVVGGMTFFAALYMQVVLGYSPFANALAFLPITLLIMGISTLGARLIGRVGIKPMMVAGMASLTAGMLLLSRLPVDGAYLSDLLPGFLFFAAGMGLTFTTSIIAATAGVSDAEQGLASGLVNTAQQVGTALGLAVLATVAAARTGGLAGAGEAPSAGDLVAGYGWAFVVGALIALAGALVAIFVVRGDECREAASRYEDPKEAAAYLAECRQASRI